MRSTSLPACALALLVAAPAGANMANPYRPGAPASSVGRSMEGPEATVLHEELVLRWSTADECLVSARYRIRSRFGGPVALHFFAPALAEAAPPRVEVGDQRPAVEVRVATASDVVGLQLGHEVGRHVEEGHVLVLAFTAVLPPGEVNVLVEYGAEVGADVDSFYPVWSSANPLVVYELWPLKSWALAEDFRLDLRVELARDATLLERLFGAPEVRCFETGQLAGQVEDGRISYRYGWARDFPDRLNCRVDESAF